MKMSKRILALLLCMVMVFSLAVTGVSAAGTADAAAESQQWLTPEYTDAVDNGGAASTVDLGGGNWAAVKDDSVQLEEGGDLHASTDLVEVIVVMKEQPLIKRAVAAGMESKISTYMAQNSTAAVEQSMLRSHDSARTQIASLCGGQADTDGYDYTVVLNGFSMTMPYGKIAEAEKLSGIKYIRESRTYNVPEDQSSYDLAMTNSVGMIGSDEVNDMSFAGADGAGTLVAILDTGIAQGHEAFSVAPKDLTKAVYGSESALQTVMNAAKLSSGVTSASATWISAKIPYAYNYANMTTSGYSTAQPHGTHVAGIVAGNNGKDFYGVAPEAQLLVMKVFDEQGSTSDAALNAGLDDAVKLGADSINMSLGSTAGFYYDRGTEDEAYNNCWDAGVNLLIAAGNEYTNAYYNQYSNNLGQADTPDNAAVASPSTSYSALSVASVNNCKVKSNFFKLGGADASDENRIAFSQAVMASTGASPSIIDYLRTWADAPSANFPSFEYVVIGGIGEEADYAAAGITGATDLSGKFVLVNRGKTNFEDKANVAKSHGAKGVIFVNNAANAGKFAPAFNNYVLPSCSISKEDGEKLAAAANKTVTFGPTQGTSWYGNVPADEQIPWVDTFPASDAYTMSDFSSWGPAPNLAIKPEISAPGGNIISSVIGGGYESYSGTSMATPHMAGAAALVRSYVKSLGITNAQEIRTLTENLMMSTAVPGINSTGAEFSPREQGAGLVNVKNAVTTKAYLSTAADTDGVTRPKAELGSNASGAFSFSFNINNLTDEALTYTLTASSLTEGIVEQDGVKFSDQVSTRLDENDFTVTYGGDAVNGVVTVPANGTAVVTVSLTLSGSYLAEMKQNFVNGNFCEGYVYLQPTEGVTLVIPYLGFVGDWATAGVVFEGAMDSNFSLAPTQFATANVMGSGIYLGEDATVDGVKSYNYDRLAFSPKIAGNQQYLAMQLGIRRNLLNFETSITSPDGQKVWSLGTDYLRKAFFYNGYGIYRTQIIGDGWTGRYYNEETGAYDGEIVPTGKYYTLTLSGYAGQQTEKQSSVSYKLWLDSGAPEVSNLQCYTDKTDNKFKLAFNVQDDHYVRNIELHDSTDSWALTYTAENFKDVEPQGSKSFVTMDLDDLCQFLADNGLNPSRVKMYVYDYSMNYSVTYIDLGPQFLSLANATVAVGDTLQMEYRVLPARLADTLKLTWSSSDKSIATVDANGVVTGGAKGTCVITATAESGLSASANLTVGDETLPPEQPEMPDNNAPVDLPSAETDPAIWDTSVAASRTDELNSRFEADGFWYKVTGEKTVQLIRNPAETTGYGNPYPDAPAALVIPKTVTNSETGKTYTVTTIGYQAFHLCTQLTSVTLPDTIRVIGDYAFQTGWGQSSITSMNLPEGLEEVGANAFNYVPVDFKLPSTLKRIGNSAFTWTGITEVQFGDAIEAVGDRAFSFCKQLVKAEVTKVTQNTEGLYMYCTALADVTIEDGVTSLPENCFFDCEKLTSITLPDSVTELKKSVFYGCGLSSLDFLNTGSVTTLGDFCFAGNDSLHDIVIPDSVTYVGANQFYWCKYVRTITFGANVAYVGNGVMSGFFIDSSVTKVVPEVRSATAGAAVRRSGYVGSMTKDGVNFDVYCGSSFVADGITYMPISATEVQVTDYDEDSVFGVVTIPETITCEGDETVYTVTSVADSLFKQKYNITEVHLPDTITSVGERAFDQIHGLNYINIPKSLTTLTGIQAFGYGGWDNLEAGEWQVDTLYIPASLKTWNVSTFSGNKYTSIVLEDGLHMVGSYGLSYNQKATSVEMASSVQYLKNNAFDNCTALESIELPEGLLYIGDQAFQGDPIKSVDLPDSVKYVGTDAFKSVKYDYSTYPSTVAYVGPSEIKLGGGVTGLGWNAFYKDAKLTAVLGSQQNLLVERCDFAETPAVVWDGKTNIPAGDYSIVPAGTTITVSGNVRIDGALYFEDDDASVVVPVGATLTIGMGADVDTDHISWTHVPVVPVQPPKPTPSTTTPAADEKPADEDKINFSDVQNPSSFYYDAVYWAAENGITTGYTSTTFAPEMLCTRAQIVTFLWRAAGSPAPASSNNPFTDVKQSDYFYKAVLWAVEKGITKGTSSTTFSPNTVCSRAEVVTFLWRYSDCPETTGAAAFTDVASSAYYAKAVAWATANNITKGVGTGRFAPTNSCSRGEIVTFLYRCLNK